MTKADFKRRAEAAFIKRNPAAQIEWIEARLVTFPTGVREYMGSFIAIAPGFRPSRMIASGSEDYVMVRS